MVLLPANNLPATLLGAIKDALLAITKRIADNLVEALEVHFPILPVDSS